MPKNRIYDFTRRDNLECQEIAKTIAQATRNRDIDGIIIIVGRKKGKNTEVYTGGSLKNPTAAAFEALRLQLTLVALHEEHAK